ncbi:MAG: hypothetical protein RLZZ08_620 [Pseudomonadota bacterium]|jgi:putative membrane protein
MKAHLLIGVAAAMTLGACNNAADDTAPAGQDTAAMVVATPTETATPMANGPQALVDAAASSDMYEMQAAEMASQNGKSQAVKDFAAMMMKDHATSTAALKDAAAKAQPMLTMPAMMTPAHQAMLDELRTAGADFDTVYARQQVTAHEQALALLRGYAGTGTDDPLAKFAATTAPVVDGHLTKARALPAG